MTYLQVRDEGLVIQDYCVQMDFVGAGVTVTRPFNNDYVTVTIPGAAAVTGWTDDGDVVRLTTTADRVAIGALESIGTEKVRIVNPAGVALRVEGRLDLPATGVADAAASQAPSFVERFTVSMWTGAAAADRDFDLYGASNSLVLDEAGGALATLFLDFEGAVLLSTNTLETILTSHSAGALGHDLQLFLDSASPADFDVVGRFSFHGNADAGATRKRSFARIDALSNDVTDTTEDGQLNFVVTNAGDQDFINLFVRASAMAFRGNLSATEGPEFSITFAKTAAGADGDVAGYLGFFALSTTSVLREVAYWTCTLVDADNATEDGSMSLNLLVAGADTQVATFDGTGLNVVTRYAVGGTQVVSAQGAAVADAAGGATIDAEARTAINDLLARLRTHGLIAP